ncbi:hypothetical protein HY642_02455 [Candidatus Woesearchaeota archaeon]|nr:hypothetical protein [Candidatus Woesearchaeota archaeon]
MLVMDCREPRSMVSLLEKRMPVRVSRLDPADYVCGDTGIERKTVDDFLRSLASGRLLEQVSRLHYAYPSAYLIVEGLLDWSALKNPGWFCNALQSIVLLGVPVLFSTTQQDSARLLTRIVLKNSKPAQPVFVPKKRAPREVQLSVLCAFPGIGEKRAQVLLRSMGTLRRVLAASRDDLRAAGLGRKTSRQMCSLLDMMFSSSARCASLTRKHDCVAVSAV